MHCNTGDIPLLSPCRFLLHRSLSSALPKYLPSTIFWILQWKYGRHQHNDLPTHIWIQSTPVYSYQPKPVLPSSAYSHCFPRFYHLRTCFDGLCQPLISSRLSNMLIKSYCSVIILNQNGYFIVLTGPLESFCRSQISPTVHYSLLSAVVRTTPLFSQNPQCASLRQVLTYASTEIVERVNVDRQGLNCALTFTTFTRIFGFDLLTFPIFPSVALII